MAKQKLKTIQAGRFIRSVLYTPTYTPDRNMERSERSKLTSAAQQLINHKYLWQKLQALIECNFTSKDLFVTLTYDNEHLPKSREQARRHIKAFIRRLRAARNSRGETTRYIYCIESRHEKGRLHHHMIVNDGLNMLELLCRLWKYGTPQDVQIDRIEAWSSKELARYMTKEPRDGVDAGYGMRAWASSQNLERPIISTVWVDPNVRLAAPQNAYVVLSESVRNEFGRYDYLEYYLPTSKPQAKYRPKKHKNS